MSWMRNALLKTFKWPVKWLVRSKDIPINISELGLDKAKPVMYLMHNNSVTDQLTLAMSAKRLGLPDPTESFDIEGESYPRCLFLRGTQPLFKKNAASTGIESVFTELFQRHRENATIDLQIVPVYVTWGRAPGKGKPGFTDLITHTATPSWLRKFFIVLFLGRDNFISYSKAVHSRNMAEQRGSDADIAQKLVRLASTHFQRKRQSMTGPTLLEVQERNNAVLGSESVRNAISDEADAKKITPSQARTQALDYLDEIAADYREGLIRFGDRALTFIWNKIYNGISVGHADRVRDLARNGHEIIYVPCHRSHMDYLLLTYVIYHEGLVTPHIAAGINLNFWPAGGIFRRGGAFFLRRSFAGNKLYTAVFKEYLELLFNKGYSVKYYPEGGRSRTGRLIPPKTGMLAMTLQAVIKGVNRPVSIVPVYIGYENVMEVKSYQSELKGKSKKKESPAQIFSAIRKLKNYGHGYVNFGTPINLNQFLDQSVPSWRESISSDPDKKPAWLTPTVNELASSVMTHINTNAAVNGMALTSLCLLSSKNHVLSERELKLAMQAFLDLLNQAPFSQDATLPDSDAVTLLHETLSLERLAVEQDDFGKLISPLKGGAALLTYYRNNIIHLFSLPGLIMAKVFVSTRAEKSLILQLVAALYPLLQKELFLYRNQDEALAYTAELIDTMKKIGLLQQKGKYLAPPESSSEHYNAAWLLSRCMRETFQRYAVVLTLLHKHKSVGRAQLEKQSRDVAERLSALYGISSPEFYDKNVFSSFTAALKENHWLDSDGNGNLCISEESTALRRDVLELVEPEIVQHLETVEV
ncbi:glycerol-3-phosphate 1-O-acyltransferase [Alteromonas sediminis]|uniref:Glycerol-3-phosphate acyltransferase n=1 Tax=Alteromonas sediminis TaxID=2259342 RepID=A0A3N5Y0U3_9ALTE|nr:glycerol-3-phosphate 1-O-acyltransferase PlsB [Alteromonas sediminis]RPJ66523.1 glycerol-3-phosphate 1-O-acyltransferase [Alteromonas sediminis]